MSGRHHCSADCDDHPFESGPNDTLYTCIDKDAIVTLNEAEQDTGKQVFKPWDQRFDDSVIVESDVDDQLLFHIPFTGSATLRSLLVRIFPDSSAPHSVSLYPNRSDLDFTAVQDSKPTESFEFPLSFSGNQIFEFPVKTRLYQNLRNLNLFFSRNDGSDDPIQIAYIGLRGSFVPFKGNPIITIYESAPNPADHPQVNQEEVYRSIS
ncbi:proteasome interacting protein [Schizosaccharomyces octosporus yFS286]|uniref:Proteasome interacting protein n=1 Tax=Schizosaccharomyces octosporus (strain yFS286) TaxID=483514 RepID=S9Q3T8_SCHOY|nr:proteasome interacting protein [Schizosaccharomyces octosporus yFS286]EPX74328.1 proteasome interacting protein [Schizosaccharomyces octosporus yFS286]